MEFKQVEGTWVGFRDIVDEELLGNFVVEEHGEDESPYFYFVPFANVSLSHRDCRKAAEKLAELNMALHNSGEGR